MKLTGWFCLLSLCMLAQTPVVSAVERAALRAAINSIEMNDLRAHVDLLADDQFEGREAGSRGGRAAGNYLIKHFQKSGLQGAASSGGFVQSFDGSYRNILGLLEGRDPELKHEVIVIGAHYDHVGYGNQSNSFGPFGYVHNGADDNASGVAGLLELVDAMTMLPEAPRRSILFALWDGEEKGLLGSKHWNSYPTLTLSQIAFAFNVDMIGRLTNNKLKVYGSRTAPGLRRLISDHNRDAKLQLDFDWELKANSDHHPFFANEIPVLMFHTGLHDDYHRPSDDAHLINADGMQDVVRLMFNVTHNLAEQEDRLAFRSNAHYESPADLEALEMPIAPLPPRFGVRWDDEADDPADGLRLNYVEYGMAAQRAGLQPGDRLLRFNGQAIENATQFRQLVLHAPSTVAVEFLRDSDEPQTAEVALDGKPTRIGISWRDDAGEPGTIVLTRVVPGSPASVAGLRSRDRVYAIAGKSFSTTGEVFELLTTLPSPIEMVVERDGKLQSVTLRLPPPEAEES